MWNTSNIRSNKHVHMYVKLNHIANSTISTAIIFNACRQPQYLSGRSNSYTRTDLVNDSEVPAPNAW